MNTYQFICAMTFMILSTGATMLAVYWTMFGKKGDRK